MLAGAVLATGVQAQETPPLGIGVIGGDGVVWAYRNDASPATGGNLLRFCYQIRSKGGASRYWPGPVVVGDVSVAVTSGTGLHTFFRDGTHRHYLPDPRIMRTGPPFADLGEVDSPGEKPPVAICWDEDASSLVAIISAAQAAALSPRVPRSDTEPAEETQSEPPADGAGNKPTAPIPKATTPPSPTIATPFAIVRYVSRRWTVDRAAPPDLLADGVVAGVLSREGTVHLIYADSKISRTYRHRLLPADADRWSDATTLTLPARAEPVALGWQDDRPTLLYREAAPAGVTFGSISLEGGVWKSGPVLAKNAAEAQTFGEPVAVSFSGTSVAVAVTDDVGDIRIGTWSVASGGAVQPLTIAPPLAPSLFPKVDPTTQHILQYAILLAALAAVFVWRRDNVMVIIPVGEHNRYARLQHRVLALILDLAILAPAWGLLLYRLIDQSDQGITLTEQLMQNRGTLPAAWFWSWAIIGGVFAVYATVFEHWLGATPGKRILGCRVVAENGTRCSLRSILIRNALRPIEFHFTAIALLVFLTPSQQRLGDILAGVIVVERVESDGRDDRESPDDDTDEDPDDFDDDSDHTDVTV